MSAHGGDNDDTRGPMRPTAALRRCPYIRQALASFETVIGRTRLMRLEAGAEVPPHFDSHYYWHDRVRVHLPVVSDPEVRFVCDGHELHMAPGEAWLLDNSRSHAVVNASGVARIHLVFDTVGSAAFWELLDRAGPPEHPQPAALGPRRIVFDPGLDARVITERCNLPAVMPATELAALIAEALADAAPEPGNPLHAEALPRFAASSRRCLSDWRATWAAHGEDPDGWAAFRVLQQRLLAELAQLPEDLRVRSNGRRLVRVLKPFYQAALDPAIVAETSRRPAALSP
ncbi:aspartyl/asparaginyl beta-hydroxylase domain-containing protein [Solimonas sp. K1W22B-7]|uniref:aspartyl/asparaginyl beta-hydroxylase domain-containing protein n=1 Tax=Solimonas sp. K1W22B-7 TaxID=2303331 RepID=UPI0013C3F91B|nr:aspartyl/asparaginyl beta-hydroxylase domain-containing protein [Solimonas sp. K1W22B-7]